MRKVGFFILLLVYLLIDAAPIPKQGVKHIAALLNPRTSSNATFVLHWKSGGEGFFSILLQLKTLHFIANCTQIRRKIHVDMFSSRHYENGKCRVSLCDYIEMPKNIMCKENNRTKSNSHIVTDLRHLNRPGDITFHGDPGWWNFSIHKMPVIKSVIASFPPFLKFQPYLENIARYVTNEILKLSTNENSRQPYIAIHWRRGDQLTTRCVRDKGMIDRSVNCGSVEFFIAQLQTLQKLFVHHSNAMTHLSGNIPIVILTNENNATTLKLLRDNGFLLPPKDVVQYLLNSSRNSSEKSMMQSYPSLLEDIEKAKHLSSEVIDLMVDAFLMMQAQDFYAYGASFIHDVIESERMRQGKSYCLHQENHSAGSFCHAYHSTSPQNRTLFQKSLQEFWRYPIISVDSTNLNLAARFPATFKAMSLQKDFSFS